MNEDELLRQNLAIYVSNDFVMKKEIFQIHYNDFFLNYFARVQTENVIRKKYFNQIYYLKLINMFAFILIVNACVFIIINRIINLMLFH